MSAWIVSKKHVDLIVNAVTNGTRDGVLPSLRHQPHKLGQMLVTECVASVSYRYPDDNVQAGELPGPCDPYYLKPYRFMDPGYRPTAAELFQAVRCYGYQSCEHPGWKGSAAHKICELIEQKIAESVPEAKLKRDAETAPWGFDEESIALCYAKGDPDGRGFLAALELDRNDGTARAAFSDWLMERGMLSEQLEVRDVQFASLVGS